MSNQGNGTRLGNTYGRRLWVAPHPQPTQPPGSYCAHRILNQKVRPLAQFIGHALHSRSSDAPAHRAFFPAHQGCACAATSCGGAMLCAAIRQRSACTGCAGCTPAGAGEARHRFHGAISGCIHDGAAVCQRAACAHRPLGARGQAQAKRRAGAGGGGCCWWHEPGPWSIARS